MAFSRQSLAGMIVRDSGYTFARKWKKFSDAGLSKLLVIADFDYTLTTYHDTHGKQADTTHGILSSGGNINADMAAQGRALFAKYYPIERSTNFTDEEKLPHMMEWWNQEHANLIQYKLTRSQLENSAKESTVQLRSGMLDMMELFAHAQVPVLIFSAGLADVIRVVLKREFSKRNKIVPPNVHVISNLMRFDENDCLEGFDGKLIHCLNKNASVVLDTAFWNHCQTEKRRNILLLGDALSDSNMTKGLDCDDDEILRVGFLNTNVEEQMQTYTSVFDIVLTNDASVAPIKVLIDQMKI